MAQWDVYPNPDRGSRAAVPFFVDLQSDLLSELDTRLVAPLVSSRIEANRMPKRLCPAFSVDGRTFILMPHEAGPVDRRVLKRRVESLRSEADRIISAVDAVLSGI